MKLAINRLNHAPDFVSRGPVTVPVHQRQWYELPRGDGLPETWCYTDRLSYSAGDEIRVFAVSSAATGNVQVLTDGVVPKRLWTGDVELCWAATPPDASVNGCGWPQVAAITVPPAWASCVCRLLLTANDGSSAEHLVVIRASPDKLPAVTLLLSDGTWNAYNDWGGSNHYEGIVEQDSSRFSPELSIHRPFAKGMISLPADAPRTLPEKPQEPDTPLYPHMEWAWREGYSKKYASAGWAMYERPFVHWAEREGFELAFLTQRDIHQDAVLLDGITCLVCVGHDEYWSRPMREAVDSYLQKGGRVARFAGNFMWQIRVSENGTRQICHKYRAREEDPLYHTQDAHLTTNLWEAPEVNYPGHTTFGLNASAGIYAGFGGLAPHGAGGFTVYRENHWAFAGTAMGYGDVLGSQAPIFGYEVDGLRYLVKDGLPFAEPAEGLPEDIEILALGLARMREDKQEGVDHLFVGDEDARFVADTLYGNTNEETLNRVNRGSGMIVHFSKGKGEVFHAGTTEWVAGLIRGDEAVEQMTRNVLLRFTAPGEPENS